MNITILGNNSALPAYNRFPTCQVVEIDGVSVMVDCGEGAQVLMQQYKVSRSRLKHIFISHLHGDHYFGLPGLLNSMSLLGRTEALYLYAPFALQKILDQVLDVADTTLSYPLHFIPLEEGAQMLFEGNRFSLFSFPVEHRIFCKGLLITEKSGGRKLLPERCRYYEVPTIFYRRLKEGEDYIDKQGFLIKNEWVTEDARSDKKYAYCADTLYTESFLPHIKNVDVLYHESTYLEADGERAAQRFHSTARQAALIARAAGARKLILGHYSSKYKNIEPFEQEARVVFEFSFNSHSGDVIAC